MNTYKYQFFQIYKIDYIPKIEDTINTGIFFFETEDKAREKQTLELFRLLTGNYKPYTTLEQSSTLYFKKFIWENDIEFAISIITNHQLTEEQYNYYLLKIEQNNPEKLI